MGAWGLGSANADLFNTRACLFSSRADSADNCAAAAFQNFAFKAEFDTTPVLQMLLAMNLPINYPKP